MATSGEGGGDEVLTAPRTWTHTDNLSSCSTAMRERPAGSGRSSVLKPSDTQWGGGKALHPCGEENNIWQAASKRRHFEPFCRHHFFGLFLALFCCGFWYRTFPLIPSDLLSLSLWLLL